MYIWLYRSLLLAQQQAVDMSEWLRRQTRNLLGFACAGSNPAVDVYVLRFFIPFLAVFLFDSAFLAVLVKPEGEAL